MYPPTITRDDLLADISEDELSQIETALAAHPVARPNVPQVIAEQVAKVQRFTVRYTLADADFLSLARKLIIWELIAAAYPGGKADADTYRRYKYEDAMKELAAIRDGKFPDLTPASSMPSGLSARAGGDYGSDTPLASRFASLAGLSALALFALSSFSSLPAFAQATASDTPLKVAQRIELLIGGDTAAQTYAETRVWCYQRWEGLLDTHWNGYRTALLAAGLPAGAQPTADADGDGFPNLLEYALGSNPNNGASLPVLVMGWTDDANPLVPTNPRSTAGTLRLYFDPVDDPYVTFTSQVTSALSFDITWTTLSSGTGASFPAGYVSLPDNQTTSGVTTRFMRLKVALD